MRNLLLISAFYFLGIYVSYSQTLVGVTPSGASQGQTLMVNMTGQNTSFGMGTSTTSAWFQQGSTTLISPNVLFITNSTSMIGEFTFCYHPLGLYDLVVYNSLDGYMVLPNSFTLNPGANPPEIILVDPDSAYRGDVLSVSITGQNTDFVQGTTTTVWLNQGSSTILRDSVNVTSATDLVAEFSIPIDAAFGLWNVNVIDGAGGCNLTVTLPDGFTIVDTTVGIQASIPEYYISVFPNPSSGLLNLNYRIPTGQIGEFCLYNIAGIQVGRYPLQGGTNKLVFSPHLKDGLYLHQIRVNGEVLTSGKLVVSNSGD